MICNHLCKREDCPVFVLYHSLGLAQILSAVKLQNWLSYHAGMFTKRRKAPLVGPVF